MAGGVAGEVAGEVAGGWRERWRERWREGGEKGGERVAGGWRERWRERRREGGGRVAGEVAGRWRGGGGERWRESGGRVAGEVAGEVAGRRRGGGEEVAEEAAERYRDGLLHNSIFHHFSFRFKGPGRTWWESNPGKSDPTVTKLPSGTRPSKNCKNGALITSLRWFFWPPRQAPPPTPPILTSFAKTTLPSLPAGFRNIYINHIVCSMYCSIYLRESYRYV